MSGRPRRHVRWLGGVLADRYPVVTRSLKRSKTFGHCGIGLRFGTEGSEVQILSPRPENGDKWPVVLRDLRPFVFLDVARNGSKWLLVVLDRHLVSTFSASELERAERVGHRLLGEKQCWWCGRWRRRSSMTRYYGDSRPDTGEQWHCRERFPRGLSWRLPSRSPAAA